MTSPDRRARGKLSTREGLEPYLDRNRFVAITRDNCLTFSTEIAPPVETATAIASALNLPLKD